ncbi:hypothetical protein [Microbacterium sp. UCD-TDU]|uniref:hypothetical protein n=1 Tax=Microbacterium sp. UCD-TDU TaxID=1247714 RepID=UPI0003454DFF|nr:hypothetical protein [Microbacterium sp. UCD-TDU]EYT57540.1 hypothetical protein D514_0117530 [Microbacterium sp. UCD-TDU]
MAIAVDFDGVFAELKRLLRELQEFPSPDEVGVAEGDVSETTREFHRAVLGAASAMSVATEKALEKLQNTHDTIRAAVLQIAEQDAALADETKLIVSLLDSAVEQAGSPTGTGTGTATGASGGSTSGDRGEIDSSTDQPKKDVDF